MIFCSVFKSIFLLSLEREFCIIYGGVGLGSALPHMVLNIANG
jgi:hypothetical protein